MKFNAWSRKRLLEGKKRLTSRSVKNAEKYDTDHDYEYKVGPLPWCFIRDYLWGDGAEGAESPEELQRVINQIFRRVVGDDEQFYVYVLRVERIVDRLKEARS